MGKFSPSDIKELEQYFHRVTNNATSLPPFNEVGDSRLVTVSSGGKPAVYLYTNNQALQLSVGNIITPNPNPISGGGGSGGSGIAVNQIIVASQALTANVAFTYTFDKPSKLVGLPDCYATQDGMFTFPIGYSLTLNEPTSFTITAISNCTMKFAYQHTS